MITQPDTPLPWINYLGSEAYFGLISNTAGGYSFYKDARLRRLTRYRYNNSRSIWVVAITAIDRFARERVHVGAWMRAHLPASTWLAVGAAGALPYASGLPVVDVYGLVDPWPSRVPSLRPTAKGRPGHQMMAPQAELRVRDPDLLCHVGHVGPRVPPQASAASRGFGPGYRWACVAAGSRRGRARGERGARPRVLLLPAAAQSRGRAVS